MKLRFLVLSLLCMSLLHAPTQPEPTINETSAEQETTSESWTANPWVVPLCLSGVVAVLIGDLSVAVWRTHTMVNKLKYERRSMQKLGEKFAMAARYYARRGHHQLPVRVSRKKRRSKPGGRPASTEPLDAGRETE